MAIALPVVGDIIGDIIGSVVDTEAAASTFTPNDLASLTQWLFGSTALTATRVVDEKSGTGTSRDPQPGRCYDFDGSDDYVMVPDDATLDITSAFSICMWVKPDNLTQTNKYLLSKPKVGDNVYAVLWEYVNDSVEFYSGQYTGDDPRTGTSMTFASADWNHIAYVYDGSTWKGYLNKVEQFSLSKTFTLDTSTENLFLGAHSTGNRFDGRLHDVRIFNTALTSAQVTSVYDGDSVAISNLKGQWKMDESAGTTSYDSSGNSNDGTITNATLSTFHATDTAITKSWQNDVGYSDGGSGVLVPRDESDTDNDVTGSALDYTGRVPYNAKLVESSCGTFDGVDDEIQFTSLAGGTTITSYEGTATPTIDTGNNKITVTAGTLYNLVLSDGTTLPIGEGYGTVAYDVSGGDNHGTLSNITESSFWAATQDTHHYNIRNGFEEYDDDATGNVIIRVPYKSGGSQITPTISGYTKNQNNPAGTYHNNSETKIQQFDSPAMRAADTNNYWFNGATINAKGYSDIVANVNSDDKIFADVTTANKYKNILSFSAALTGTDLNNVKDYVNIT